MIKLFRKIRYNLIKKGQTGKYFKYAIGEIILVVIGILIALSINNWNEDRKQKLAINQGLLEVRNNMVNDSMAISKSINLINEELAVQKEIIKDIEKGILLDSTYNQKLGKCMTVGYTPITQNGYKALQTVGLENIDNKNLENQLIKFYENLKKNFENEAEDDRVDLIEVWLPYVRKNFKDYDYRNYAIPKNYKNLSSDSEFFVMLKINKNNREATLLQITNLQKVLKELVLKIDERLELEN